MTGTFDTTDYMDWDWLPGAAAEIEVYLERLLTEGSITAHVVEARSKSIASFQRKCAEKGYEDPRRQVTDTVAVRLIMYSDTDESRAVELIRERFEVLEDFNPGDAKPPQRRGYDCAHLVVTGEQESQARDWLVASGDLRRYFDRFGGLEIQVRTVAAHAWAEFEHSRRYKGVGYRHVSTHDQQTIDQLFGAAADARRALDETFTAIERVLANPTRVDADEDDDQLEESRFEDDQAPEPQPGAADGTPGAAAGTGADGPEASPTVLDAPSLKTFLAARFPDDNAGSDRGIEFACELVRACGLTTLTELARELEAIDSAEVRDLMDTTTAVTRVRRLDDELLALYGEEYISSTESIGAVGRRGDQLRWRYDRLRDKVSLRRRPVVFQIFGADCPESIQARKMPAPRVVRELARIVAEREGAASVVQDGAISLAEDLPLSARPRPVRLQDGTDLWIATTLRREHAESLMAALMDAAPALDLRVMRNGLLFLPLST
ncbi:hypothetical protein H3H54_01815 [Brachybacterium sp. Z12]|uniref:GTP pyrophosphokinase n=1 Tax=Brachybacterium sp. Z12 TaxID=2759167 RepID=UPI0018619CF7|nr:hypothetical protein [Brachybacterium sp. Z12]QNN82712.1 hypothetical protein H3H54_01815 [Brachybacterium sp. Z12]